MNSCWAIEPCECAYCVARRQIRGELAAAMAESIDRQIMEGVECKNAPPQTEFRQHYLGEWPWDNSNPPPRPE